MKVTDMLRTFSESCRTFYAELGFLNTKMKSFHMSVKVYPKEKRCFPNMIKKINKGLFLVLC